MRISLFNVLTLACGMIALQVFFPSIYFSDLWAKCSIQRDVLCVIRSDVLTSQNQIELIGFGKHIDMRSCWMLYPSGLFFTHFHNSLGSKVVTKRTFHSNLIKSFGWTDDVSKWPFNWNVFESKKKKIPKKVRTQKWPLLPLCSILLGNIVYI